MQFRDGEYSQYKPEEVLPIFVKSKINVVCCVGSVEIQIEI